jgi:hypothetical protein
LFMHLFASIFMFVWAPVCLNVFFLCLVCMFLGSCACFYAHVLCACLSVDTAGISLI